VVAPVAIAIGQTHMFRHPIGQPPDESYAEVSFAASDGLRLSGWYRPSSNGAAVVIVASARGDRTGSVQHARLLAAHGYGVLVYDARGTGKSQGSPNGYGWDWSRDVSGALTFLQHRPDVDPHRIGGLGISTGADVLLEAAAEDHDLRAVVSDGATGRSASDVATMAITERPMLWVTFGAVRLLSGSSAGPPLRTLVARISPTPLLLVAAGSISQEIPFNTDYAAAAHEPVELWTLPHVRHTAAIREAPEEYERRVTAVFDQGLHPRAAGDAGR
jgi:dienelactone hydrolase